MVELALRFLLVGGVAFGGGQAALPLVERLAVHQTGWLSARDFAVAVGLAYVTPGPVLIIAAFVGYRVGGVAGAVVATLSVFALPVAVSAAAAQIVARLSASARFRTFGRFAGAAAIGLLGVTMIALARPLLGVDLLLGLPVVVVLAAALRGVPPLALVALSPAGGAGIGVLSA